ncbi:hypothetical protein HXX01_00775 [Candidatus Nomurabacteria bacterium]|nr:hypothetical protein [Candidatus Nomurabacteria bacterium]
MDIKELDKKQLILLTLLITFVVSIATGIVTVSLMNQMPKSVPQTINNVIQKTIERVTTVETPAKTDTTANTNAKEVALLGDGDAVVSIYTLDTKVVTPTEAPTPAATADATLTNTTPAPSTITTDKQALGQGIIISDIGLVLVDSSILNESLVYKVILNKKDFDATILKKFGNGFTVLKISEKKTTAVTPVKTDTTKTTQ